MLKITAKEVSRLLGIKEGYVYQLLKRKGIRLNQEDLGKIIELICLRKGRNRDG